MAIGLFGTILVLCCQFKTQVIAQAATEQDPRNSRAFVFEIQAWVPKLNIENQKQPIKNIDVPILQHQDKSVSSWLAAATLSPWTPDRLNHMADRGSAGLVSKYLNLFRLEIRSATEAARNEDYWFAAEGHDVYETLNRKNVLPPDVSHENYYPAGIKYCWQSKKGGSADQNVKQIIFKNVDHDVQNKNESLKITVLPMLLICVHICIYIYTYLCVCVSHSIHIKHIIWEYHGCILYMYICIHVYIYIYIYTYSCVYIYICIPKYVSWISWGLLPALISSISW